MLCQYDHRLITNRCATERLILQLFGLNLRKGQNLNALMIGGAKIDYEILGPNSNTYVWTLLDLCGIPVTKPPGTFPAWRNNAIKDVLKNDQELQAKLKAKQISGRDVE